MAEALRLPEQQSGSCPEAAEPAAPEASSGLLGPAQLNDCLDTLHQAPVGVVQPVPRGVSCLLGLPMGEQRCAEAASATHAARQPPLLRSIALLNQSEQQQHEAEGASQGHLQEVSCTAGVGRVIGSCWQYL